MKKKPFFLGFPKCVCGDPFTLVNTPAELRQYTKANPEWDKDLKPRAKPGPKPKVAE